MTSEKEKLPIEEEFSLENIYMVCFYFLRQAQKDKETK